MKNFWLGCSAVAFRLSLGWYGAQTSRLHDQHPCQLVTLERS